MIHNDNNEFLETKLQSGITTRAVSDGSYHTTYQYVTSAWIITIQNNKHAITGPDVVPSDTKSQFSCRSELCGLIGDIRHINNICSTYNILEGSAELGCDGLEAYNVATRYEYAPPTKISHYDLSSNLHQLIKASPLSWNTHHVIVHQDNGDTYNNIDEWG